MEKINIAELLKDCPKGMELDCMIYDNIVFDGIQDWVYPIRVVTKDGEKHLNLTKYGCTSENKNAKCVIFPKGKTTWEGFVPPCQFKDGDIITSVKESNPFIFHYDNGEFYDVHCALINDYLQIYKRKNNWVSNRREFRYATEEEKQKLFDAIKAKGYCWNQETKTLEKLPRFKVGDRIIHKDSGIYCTLGGYSEGISAYRTNIGLSLTYKDLEHWELAPNKFDINTLKPFDKVLVRDYDNKVWKTQFFEKLNNRLKYKFICVGGNRYYQCIPYEGNENLLNTSNEPDDFYINWEN